MAFIRAPVFLLAALVLLLASGVNAGRYFQPNGMEDSSTLKEYHAKSEAIHAKLFKDALEEYQLHTHMVPDEKVKASIATALEEHIKAHPQEVGNARVKVASKRSQPFSNGEAFHSSLDTATTRKSKVDCEDDSSNATVPAGSTSSGSETYPETPTNTGTDPQIPTNPQTNSSGTNNVCKATCEEATSVTSITLDGGLTICLCYQSSGSMNFGGETDEGLEDMGMTLEEQKRG